MVISSVICWENGVSKECDYIHHGVPIKYSHEENGKKNTRTEMSPEF